MSFEQGSFSDGCVSRRGLLGLAAAGAAGAVGLVRPGEALAAGSREFVDDLGRRVSLPRRVRDVVPAGVPAQTLMTTLCPEGLATLAVDVSRDAKDYADAGLSDVEALPDTGTLSSPAGGDLDAGVVAEVGPQVTLDAGCPKDGLAGRLDALQEESGSPAVFLDLSFGRLPGAYRALGALTGCEERAEALARHVERALGLAALSSGAAAGAAPRVFYAPREMGVALRGGVEAQLDAIRHVGAEPVTSPYDWESRTVDIGAVAAAEPDLVVFGDTALASSLLSKEGEGWFLWGAVPAVGHGAYISSPALMHSWLASPVLVQHLGVLWLGGVLWGESCGYAVDEEARAFYELFYGLDKEDAELRVLLGIGDQEEHDAE